MPDHLALIQEIAERRGHATRCAHGADAMMRWLLICPALFGIAAIVGAHRVSLDTLAALCLAMMICSSLGMAFDFPAQARRHAVLGRRLAQLEDELAGRAGLTAREHRSVRARLSWLER